MDTEMDGMATGLSTCILKDGTQAVTANIPFSTYKITDLGAGTARTDAANMSNIQDSTATYAASGGSAGAYTLTLAPAITAYAAGQTFSFKANHGTMIGVPTLNVSAVGAKNIYGTLGINTDDLIVVEYDGTKFQVISSRTARPGTNLLINGEMKVAQRGATSGTITSQAYWLDGWQGQAVGGGDFVMSQSTTVPNATFVNSLKVNVGTVDSSLAATDRYWVAQAIEGLRCSRISFGTAAAQSVTLSFWFRADSSDLTFPATFSGSLQNSALDRSYPFTFTQTTNATWQKHTVTIAGDQTGTWLQTSGIGLWALFSLACGSTRTGTGGAWAAANYQAATGQVNGMNHTSNDFYWTGVQLEVGSIATPFEYRSYGEELALCKRYFRRYTGAEDLGYVYYYGTAVARFYRSFEVEMRAAPTATVTSSDLTLSYGATSTVACNSFGAASNGASPFGYMSAVGVATTPFTIGQVGSIEIAAAKALDFSAEL